jgi:hypothetical protein
VFAPIAGGNLLGDQFVGRLFVRHAQQRLGEAHEREALGVGQSEFLEEALHDALAALQVAGARDKRAGLGVDAGAGGGIERRVRQQCGDRGLFILVFQRVERVPVGSGGGVSCWSGLHGRHLRARGPKGKRHGAAPCAHALPVVRTRP